MKWLTAGGLKIKRGGHLFKWFEKNKSALYGWHKPKPKPAPSPAGTLTMYDDINLSLIPKDAEAVAGYVGGRWPTYNQLVKDFPHAKHLSIAINASEDADCLDIERFDATPDQAPAWVRRQHARGKKLPVLYVGASACQGLINTLSKAGLQHGRDYKLWTAHYWSPKPHFCGGVCGFPLTAAPDATQYWDKALGRSLDVSICLTSFFA